MVLQGPNISDWRGGAPRLRSQTPRMFEIRAAFFSTILLILCPAHDIDKIVGTTFIKIIHLILLRHRSHAKNLRECRYHLPVAGCLIAKKNDPFHPLLFPYPRTKFDTTGKITVDFFPQRSPMTTSTACFFPDGRSWRTRAPQSRRLNGVA